MSVIVVPKPDRKPWPTLGLQVCGWIEEHLAFGPGDLLGDPAVIDEEKQELICKMYELVPRGRKGAGRRRFSRCALSLRKGSAKTELAAWLAIAELHPDAPVRFDGWEKNGTPARGVGVRDPYIPLVATTAEQSDELAFGAMRAIIEHSDLAADFDVGLERIMRIDGHGKATSLANAPGARDGARTTFEVFDESHLMILPRMKKAHRTMLANLPKRKLADAWALEVTTAPEPGAGSVAEDTMAYAQSVAEGRQSDSKLFFFHRQATEGKHNLSTKRGRIAAIREASGPVAAWSDVAAIADQWKDPRADKSWLCRVWLNMLVHSADKAFDVTQWRKLARKGYRPEAGAMITIGFDGAKFQDATAAIGTEVETGIQFVIGIWERPPNAPKDYEIATEDVDAAIAAAFETWTVWRMYADPPYWEELVAKWAGDHGEECVVRWHTTRSRRMADECRSFANAIGEGLLAHDGDPVFERHVANTYKRTMQVKDEQGVPQWTIQKERADSPKKIDAAMAGILSWAARRDALTMGVTGEPWSGEVTVYG